MPQMLNAQCLDFDLSTLKMELMGFTTFHMWGTPYIQVPVKMDFRDLSYVPLPSTYARQPFCKLYEPFPGLGIYLKIYVPTIAERLGDYRDLLTGRSLGTDPLGRTIWEGEIYDPVTERIVFGQVTRDTFPNNIIPMARMGSPFIWLATEPTEEDVAQNVAIDVEELQASGTLTDDQASGLIAKLDSAISSMSNEKSGTACNQLSSFINQVNAFIRSGKLSPEEGQHLISAAQSLRSKLGC